MEKFALISQVSITDLPLEKQALICKALNVQGVQHLYPYHGKSGSIEILDSLPSGYIPLYIQYDIKSSGQDGFHWVDENGNPFVKIKFDKDFDELTRITSHEYLETIINPQVDKFGQTSDFMMLNRKGEEYFEICDICQSKEYSYRIDGVLVSNFVTPSYYNINLGKTNILPNVKYDFCGYVKEPGEILEGGYKSWKLSDTEYLQAFRTKGELVYKYLTGDKVVEVSAVQTGSSVLIPSLAGLFVLFLFWIFNKK